jgi:hypothetical protein
MIVLDDLDAKNKARTPGDWATSSEWSVRAPDDEMIANCTAYDRHAADAEVIAAAVNALDPLVQIARAAQQVTEIDAGLLALRGEWAHRHEPGGTRRIHADVARELTGAENAHAKALTELRDTIKRLVAKKEH